MSTMDTRATAWAESNSSPGVAGRDETYEMLIVVQAEAWKSGYRKALKEAAEYIEGYDELPAATADIAQGVLGLEDIL